MVHSRVVSQVLDLNMLGIRLEFFVPPCEIDLCVVFLDLRQDSNGAAYQAHAYLKPVLCLPNTVHTTRVIFKRDYSVTYIYKRKAHCLYILERQNR